MKTILSLLFMLPVFAVAQEDCQLKDVKDPLNQDTRLSSGFFKMGGGNDRFMVSGETDKRELDFFFVIDEAGLCFDEYARVQVIFEGGKLKGNYRNGGAENCKGYFHIIYKNQENQPALLQNLATRKVITMKFITKDRKEKIINLGPEEQDTLLKIVSCILENSKALLNDTWKPK